MWVYKRDVKDSAGGHEEGVGRVIRLSEMKDLYIIHNRMQTE